MIKLQQAFDSGGSRLFIIIIFVITIVLLVLFTFRKNILSDWAYESIIDVPKRYQQIPLVKKWFELTRGVHYDIRHEPNKPITTYLNASASKHMPRRSNCLLSGFAFLHFVLHFLIAFFCPKLVPFSFMCGVGWEIVESIVHAHCTLDIFWNMCGCLFGLLLRNVLFPIHIV